MVLMNLSARQQWRHRHREESCGHRRRRRGGKGGTNSESNTETYALPYDPKISLMGICPEKTIIQTDTCTLIFVAALFTIAKTWKQPRWHCLLF